MQKIIGIGVDIVSNQRMSSILKASYQLRFLHKVLHPNEIEYIQKLTDHQQQSQYLASRWAVKEALVKASSFKELIFPDVEIIKKNGKPTIVLHNSNKLEFNERFQQFDISVSISHEDIYSIAFLILHQY